MKREINDTWAKRKEIEPSYGVVPKPQIIEILKLLPKSNCRECGQKTCMVFSSLVMQGAKGPEPTIDEVEKGRKEGIPESFG